MSGEPVVEVAPSTIEHKARVVVVLNQIQQWCAVTRAYLALAQKSVHASVERHSAVLPPPRSEVDEIVPKLVQHELYETAVELCAAYGLPLAPIFEKLATRCISLQMQRGTEMSTMQRSPKRLARSACPPIASHDSHEWKLLFRLLVEYDQRHNNQHGETPAFELHKAVLECILAEDSKLGFPVTLLHTFKR